MRLVFDHPDEYLSRREASAAISCELGIRRETLGRWVRDAERDDSQGRELSSKDQLRMQQLERENRELRRANEILKSAATYFGAELERHLTK